MEFGPLQGVCVSRCVNTLLLLLPQPVCVHRSPHASQLRLSLLCSSKQNDEQYNRQQSTSATRKGIWRQNRLLVFSFFLYVHSCIHSANNYCVLDWNHTVLVLAKAFYKWNEVVREAVAPAGAAICSRPQRPRMELQGPGSGLWGPRAPFASPQAQPFFLPQKTL